MKVPIEDLSGDNGANIDPRFLVEMFQVRNGTIPKSQKGFTTMGSGLETAQKGNLF